MKKTAIGQEVVHGRSMTKEDGSICLPLMQYNCAQARIQLCFAESWDSWLSYVEAKRSKL